MKTMALPQGKVCVAVNTKLKISLLVCYSGLVTKCMLNNCRLDYFFHENFEALGSIYRLIVYFVLSLYLSLIVKNGARVQAIQLYRLIAILPPLNW